MNRQQAYLAIIQQVCPDLPTRVTAFDADRENNDVIFVDDEFIFRFPKHNRGVAQLEKETRILTAIQGQVTAVWTPNPICLSFEPEIGQAFMGYRMIHGDTATSDDFVSVTEATQRPFATQLATFLKQLHSVPLTDIGIELPLVDTILEWTDMYSRIRASLFHHMRPDAQEWTAQHFETFLNDQSNFDYEPALRHGDIGPDNIIVDKASRAIKGVVDFGSAGLGDPAVDVAWIHYRSGVGETFLNAFSEVYPEIKGGLKRARFYAGTFALQQALFGIENDNAGAFRDGIGEYA